jgi:hypothetical protein
VFARCYFDVAWIASVSMESDSINLTRTFRALPLFTLYLNPYKTGAALQNHRHKVSAQFVSTQKKKSFLQILLPGKSSEASNGPCSHSQLSKLYMGWTQHSIIPFRATRSRGYDPSISRGFQNDSVIPGGGRHGRANGYKYQRVSSLFSHPTSRSISYVKSSSSRY